MSNNINLVSGSGLQLEKEAKRLKNIRIIAFTSLVVVALISLVVFLITVTLPISSVKKNQEETLSNISALHKKLVKYSLIGDRLQNITEIERNRKNYSVITSTVLEKVPVDLSVESLIVESGTFEIGLSGTSLVPINEYIDSIIVLSNQAKVIKNLIIDSLVLNPTTGRYTLTMKADIL